MRQLTDTAAVPAADHPAAQAWARLHRAAVDSAVVAPLKPQTTANHKSGVYRVQGLLPNGKAVIAKRALQETARTERQIYEKLLPQLPSPGLNYYGFLEEPGDGFCWLFLEDAGDVAFSPANHAHRVLLSHWLARLHTCAVDRSALDELPERGLANHHQHLQSARSLISENLANPALRRDQVAVLEETLRCLDRTDAIWSVLSTIFNRLPSTLVHGDIKSKNVRVRETAAVPSLCVFDWEHAGRARPAIDLYSADVPTYWRAVRDHWPDVDLRTVEEAAEVGLLLRTVAALRWDAQSLAYPWLDRLMSRIACYRTTLKQQLLFIERGHDADDRRCLPAS